jgi:AraC family transcriptional regulator
VEFHKPSNAVIRFRAYQMRACEEHDFLAIRCAFNGQRRFETPEGRFAVDDSAYLIMNTGEDVRTSIDSPTEVESFSVFFRPGMAEETLRSLITPSDRLLDDSRRQLSAPVRFFEKLYCHDQILSPALFDLRAALAERSEHEVTRGWMEERFHDLLERLLLVHRNVGREIEMLPAVRQATRIELYQRLHRARDYMDASLSQSLPLSEMAESAYFSTHHFLRLFKKVFGETPHQYLTRRRLEEAKRLLVRTEQPVTDICGQVGFDSLGSFSWLFRQRIGMSPMEFRQHHHRRTRKKG